MENEDEWIMQCEDDDNIIPLCSICKKKCFDLSHIEIDTWYPISFVKVERQIDEYKLCEICINKYRCTKCNEIKNKVVESIKEKMYCEECYYEILKYYKKRND